MSAVRGFAIDPKTPLVSFDGGVAENVRLTRPDRFRHLEALDPDEPRIVRGGGYSYAAAGFGAGALVQDTRAFDRILAFDAAERTVECEAGATLEKLHSLLTPRGFYLPSQPGYPRITLGGCLAADVHGKNQSRDGNFGQSVLGMRLFHPRHGFLDLGPGDEAFELTRGGLGLTGQVVSLRLRVAPLPSPIVAVKRQRIADIDETIPRLEAAGKDAPFLYTWQDFTAQGAGFGRGFCYSGRFATEGERPPFRESPYSAIEASTRGRPGFAFFGRWTTPAFNRAYDAAQASTAAERHLPLFDFLFPVARKVAYFRLFGRRGFHESQLLLPRAAFAPFARELRHFLVRHPTPITLASAKLFDGAPRFLRFLGPGVCLALDFPRGADAERLLPFLDDAVVAHRGRANVMKDSRLAAGTVRGCYPEYEVFKDALHRFDPSRLYRSELSVRLGL